MERMEEMERREVKKNIELRNMEKKELRKEENEI